MAGSGLPDATKAFMTSEAERGLGTGIRGILESGGSPSDISKLFDVFDTSVMRTGAEDAQARLANIKNTFDVNKDLAGQKEIQFGVNELQPYQSALQSIQKRREAAQTNMFGGAQTAVGSIGAVGTELQNQGLLKQMLKGNNSPKEDMYNKLFSGADVSRPTAFNPSTSTLQNRSLAYPQESSLYDAELLSRLLNRPQ